MNNRDYHDEMPFWKWFIHGTIHIRSAFLIFFGTAIVWIIGILILVKDGSK